MRRRLELLKLSREHHGALVLCLRIGRADDAATVAALMDSVPKLFTDELEAHFRDEETDLLPRLLAAGEGNLVRRTLDEHRELRRLAAAISGGDYTALKTFGRLLNDHVRFEERELFAVAENRLPEIFPAISEARQLTVSLPTPATHSGVMP